MRVMKTLKKQEVSAHNEDYVKYGGYQGGVR